MDWGGRAVGGIGGSEVDRPEKFWGREKVIDIDWIQE